jgi:hypothetical protein
LKFGLKFEEPFCLGRKVVSYLLIELLANGLVLFIVKHQVLYKREKVSSFI